MRTKSITRNCPRCGERSLEHYFSYGYCPNCNFNTEEGFHYEKKKGEIIKIDFHPDITAISSVNKNVI